MDERAYRSVAEAVRLLAVAARGEARELDARRSALARNALVWWQGGAAERYQGLVRARVGAFAELAGYLDALAGQADDLGLELEAAADLQAVVSSIRAAHPKPFR